jgi:ParB family chromosome partitioning protein
MTNAALKTETPAEGPQIYMRPIRLLKLASEAPKGAKLQVRDSGRGSPMTDAELKASIYTHGIIRPLIFKNYEGQPYVIAGNRRLKLLREIFSDSLDSRVQTQDADEFSSDWRSIALDDNLSLPPHVIERYETIVALVKELKLPPEEARARYGLTKRQFDQVMALGRMSDKVRSAWKEGEIDAKTAQAFTLEPDPKEQDKIFETLKKSAFRGRVTESDVRGKIVPVKQREAGTLVAFVGIEECKRAKIIKQEDLFSSSHIVTDLKVLSKMAADRIKAQCEWLVQDGWKWAIPIERAEGSHWHYHSLDPSGKTAATEDEEKRLSEINETMQSDDEHPTEFFEQLEDEQEKIQEAIKSRGFTPAQRAKSGCFLKIGHDGSLVIEYGKVRPSEQKTVQAAERRETAKPNPKGKAGEVTLTNALAERLSAQLEEAVSASLHATPHVAAAALIAGFASSGHVIDVRVGNGSTAYVPPKKAEADFAQVFAGARKSSTEAIIVMLTKIAAEALSIQIHSAQAKSPIDDAGLQALTAAMDAKFLNNAIKKAFDAKDYFSSVNLQVCVDAVRAGMGDEHAAKVAKMKKADAAKFAAANVPGTGWLPKQLRTIHYKGPVEAAPVKAAKKDKKPKPVKKAPAKKKKR